MSGPPGPPGRVRKARIEVPQPAPDPPAQPELAGPEIAPPRLARYELVLPSGATVGVAVCGAGVPLVVIHGFGGEGILYAQTLSRLVRLGYLVLTIDAPGHGRSQTIPLWSDFERYTSLVTQTLDHLGIERAIFVGHSMGGRVVAELGARQPHRVIAIVLVDAIVGDGWDAMVDVFRVLPALYAGFGLGLLADTASTLVRFDNPRQALKLARLLAPTGVGHVLRPWRLAGPMLTILRASSSDVVLQRVREHGLTVCFVHGDRDVLVPRWVTRVGPLRPLVPPWSRYTAPVIRGCCRIPNPSRLCSLPWARSVSTRRGRAWLDQSSGFIAPARPC